MTDAVNAKFAIFDLLKVPDSIHDGEYHDEFKRVAAGLNLELPAMAPPSDQAFDGEAEADGEAQAGERICQFLAAQTEPATLGRIVAELNANRWTVNSTLHRLLKKGNVKHVGRDAWKIAAPVEP